MNSRLVAAILAAAWLPAGCAHYEYRLQMRPEGDGLRRTITVTPVEHGGQNAGAGMQVQAGAEMQAVADAYGQLVVQPASNPQCFTGLFPTTLPADVGGKGWRLHCRTEFGSAWVYLERFRGSGDLSVQLEKRFAAADRITDVLIGWFRAEMRGQGGHAELERFLDTDLRRDLKDLSVYLWATKIRPPEPAGPDLPQPGGGSAPAELVHLVAVAGEFLLDRGYLQPADLPVLTRAVARGDEGGTDTLLALLRRKLAARMGVAADAPVPASLSFLEAARAGASLERYLRTTPEYAELLRQSASAPAAPVTSAPAEAPEPPDAMQVLTDLAGVALRVQFDLFGTDDRLTVELLLPTEPVATNGQWDARARKIRWSARLDPRTIEGEPKLPVLCYAVVAEPDEPAQRRHFGRIALRGWPLVQYCLWRRGLTAQEAGEWDRFVQTLRPGNYRSAMENFLFSGEQARKTPVETGLARFVSGLLEE